MDGKEYTVHASVEGSRAEHPRVEHMDSYGFEREGNQNPSGTSVKVGHEACIRV